MCPGIHNKSEELVKERDRKESQEVDITRQSAVQGGAGGGNQKGVLLIQRATLLNAKATA